jgi:hypothetical protein
MNIKTINTRFDMETAIFEIGASDIKLLFEVLASYEDDVCMNDKISLTEYQREYLNRVSKLASIFSDAYSEII